MKDFCNGPVQTPASQPLVQDLLYETLMDNRPGDIEVGNNSSGSITHHSETLRAALERTRKQLEARANALNKKRRTNSYRRHWQIRGRQELLRFVADRLHELCTNYNTSYALYLALKDCLECLEKYDLDVEEEQQMRTSNTECPIPRWKAEGAARELPAVFADLTSLLAEYSPRSERHMLSLDGKSLTPLGESTVT